MTTLLGGECNIWLVLALLALAAGLGTALLAAVRNDQRAASR